jgi:phosphoribosylglycinamide formyltransferase 1
MRQFIYKPPETGSRMTIVCFVSGSGTNYSQIAARNPNHDYVVFTNRPGCGGAEKARANGHMLIELSHLPYLKDAKKKYSSDSLPRNCPERTRYEQDAWRLIKEKVKREPDLVCLAGYDQWITDWMVDSYYPKILNIHPGDTTRGYDGLYWIPTAKAIIAGDRDIRATLFLVDKGEDTGPVLVQSRPLNISGTLAALESKGEQGLKAGLKRIIDFKRSHAISSYEAFKKTAGAEDKETMKQICQNLQEALKVAGDWEIYPFAVHDLIARGRVEIDGRTIFIDGRPLPAHGYRMEEHCPE